MDNLLNEGARVYNRGDVCNPDHFGTVTKVITGKWGAHYEITPDGDAREGKPYTIPAAMVNTVDKGNGSTRIVTEEAHRAFRTAQAEQFRAEHAAMMRRRGQ